MLELNFLYRLVLLIFTFYCMHKCVYCNFLLVCMFSAGNDVSVPRIG